MSTYTWNLYLVDINRSIGYDEFDSWVVVARSSHQAVRIDPNDSWRDDGLSKVLPKPWEPQLTATFLGKAGARFTKPEVICASFNAG